jgi:hypothetical protein
MTARRRGWFAGLALLTVVVALVLVMRAQGIGPFAPIAETPVQARESGSNGPDAKGDDKKNAGGEKENDGTKDSAKADKPLHDDTRKVSMEARNEALTRAQVWRQPATPVGNASFAHDPSAPTDISCKFKIAKLGGTTPKFDCELPNGEEIRIKYGKGPEIPAEAGTTRLLRALGFGADHVTLIERLKCFGCPEEPFSTMKAVEVTRAESLYERVVDYNKFEDFDWVALERKFEARPIETERAEGWAFFELKTIDPARGGAPRAHVDALRLLAVFLVHWDNKPENQRLVCTTKNWKEGTPCPEPFALVQDTGATWGPVKVDLEGWEKAPIWDNRATCHTSMRDFPYDGATFEAVQVTEGGRQMLGKLLAQLTDAQLRELFSAARFDKRRGIFTTSRPVSEWVRVFKARVRQITEGPACPVA